jgi:hypothetical protein
VFFFFKKKNVRRFDLPLTLVYVLCITGFDNNQMVFQQCTSYTICSLFGAFWFYKHCESG